MSNQTLNSKFQKYIPLDKSWIMRMGILDLLHGRNDILQFLDEQEYLSDDLFALKKALEDWLTGDVIDVGESGTLFRFLQFVSWKYGLNKKFTKHKTLKERKICSNSEIINYPLSELLKLDHGTSQWASAAVLCGNTEKIENPPFKLSLTYKTVDHWNSKRQASEKWEPKYDKTISVQAEAFLRKFKG